MNFIRTSLGLAVERPGQETLPIAMFNYLRFDFDGTIAAASCVSILLAVILVIGIERMIGLQEYTRL
jgi:putative spermidine/putrescine transport system permease protein